MICTVSLFTRILKIENPARYPDFGLTSGGMITVVYGSTNFIYAGYYGYTRNYGVLSQ
jgi:hypothetical protein